MSPEQVEQQVIELIHREPFVPFLVEMNDGQFLEVPHPRLAINAGGALLSGAPLWDAALRTTSVGVRPAPLP